MIDMTRLDATGVVRAAVECRRTADRAEAELLALAAHWADLNAVLPGGEVAALRRDRDLVDGTERLLPLAGDGTPEVAEFAPAELGAALGMSSHAASRLVGDSLELRHRLPRLWALVQAGRLQAWRARTIAQHTACLPPEAAAFVDAQLAPVAHKIGLHRVMTLVEVALRRFDPAAAERRERESAEGRGVWLSAETINGTRSITIEADALDATRFDQAVDDVAAALAALGDTDRTSVRRSKAVGVLADPQQALDLLTGEPTHAAAGGATGADHEGAAGLAAAACSARPATSSPIRPGTRPRATLYVHLSSAALTSGSGTARVEGLGPVTLGLVQTWLGRHDISVRPVLDLASRVAVDSYETPEAMRETVLLRTPCCPFPWCGNLSRRKDMDHVKPYVPPEDGGAPGQTAAHLLAPLCRRHHRYKTHGGWSCSMPEPGVHLWRSPLGRHYLVDHTGTRRLDDTG